MDIDVPGASNGGNEGVEANISGVGRPYAPENWPNPGDMWGWKSGSSTRLTSQGIYRDRLLYPPSGLQGCTVTRFRSEKAVKAFIQEAFPDRDVNAFFASFTWNIPAKDGYVKKGSKKKFTEVVSPVEEVENSGPDSKSEGEVCKGNNKLCISLLEPHSYSSELMACDICCIEPGFCRHCCCILCGKHVAYAHGGYSFIICEAALENGTICGHIAHIDCALRSHMAGTVGGTINLDAEYYCTRCHNITDFIPHVSKILQSCESIESLEEIETVMSVGSCVLIGSQKTRAKELLERIEVVMAKLKDGASLVDLWKMEGVSSDIKVDEMEAEEEPLQGLLKKKKRKFDLRKETIKLEDQIDKTLHAMRSAQRAELRIADDSLHTQKNLILNLYQKLDQEKLKRKAKTSSESSKPLLKAIRQTKDQIKIEVGKLRDMTQVAKGFVMTPKDILEKHFGLKINQ